MFYAITYLFLSSGNRSPISRFNNYLGTTIVIDLVSIIDHNRSPLYHYLVVICDVNQLLVAVFAFLFCAACRYFIPTAVTCLFLADCHHHIYVRVTTRVIYVCNILECSGARFNIIHAYAFSTICLYLREFYSVYVCIIMHYSCTIPSSRYLQRPAVGHDSIHFMNFLSGSRFGGFRCKLRINYRTNISSLADYGLLLYSSAFSSILLTLDVVHSTAAWFLVGVWRSTLLASLYVEPGFYPLIYIEGNAANSASLSTCSSSFHAPLRRDHFQTSIPFYYCPIVHHFYTGLYDYSISMDLLFSPHRKSSLFFLQGFLSPPLYTPNFLPYRYHRCSRG